VNSLRTDQPRKERRRFCEVRRKQHRLNLRVLCRRFPRALTVAYSIEEKIWESSWHATTVSSLFDIRDSVDLGELGHVSLRCAVICGKETNDIDLLICFAELGGGRCRGARNLIGIGARSVSMSLSGISAHPHHQDWALKGCH
jgi:hypothetical protein